MYIVKAHQYTPGLAQREVGRPETRFICELCKNNLINENDLRKHIMTPHKNDMMTINKYTIRTRLEMKLEPIQRVASVTKSPPKKLVKEVSNLETRNINVVETADHRDFTSQGSRP